MALLGELHGVADQVEQRLAQAHRVGGHPADARLGVDDELQPLGDGLGLQQLRDALHQGAGVDRLGRELKVAGLDLREVDHVVQQLGQHGAAAQRLFQQAAAVGDEAFRLQQVQHAHHPVQRRADFVAHVGEEGGLGLGGGLGGALGLDQRQLLALLGVAVLHQADGLQPAAGAGDLEVVVDADPALGPVGPHDPGLEALAGLLVAAVQGAE